MSTIYFKPIPSAPAYTISKKGEITNAAGFPVKAIDGKVRLTIGKDRKYFKVSDLVKETWNVEMVEEPVVSVLDVELPKVPTAPAASTDENAPTKEQLDAIIENNKKNAIIRPSRAKSVKVQSTEKKSNKLTWEIVRDIRRRVAAGEKRKEIAALYSIHESSIWDIHTRLTWKNDPEDAAKAAE